MQATPYFLVLVAAVLHAYWNYLLERAGGGQLFVGLSKVAEVALFLASARVSYVTGAIIPMDGGSAGVI